VKKKQTTRRRRADLTGYKVVVCECRDPAAREDVYQALCEEFWRWRERVRAAEKK